jgi:hypothetical protein
MPGTLVGCKSGPALLQTSVTVSLRVLGSSGLDLERCVLDFPLCTRSQETTVLGGQVYPKG